MPPLEDIERFDKIEADIKTLFADLRQQEHRHYTHEHKGTDLSKRLDLVSPQNAYGGVINSNGTSSVIPSGWTSGLASHKFTVTHNLGTTDYGVTATPTNILGHTEVFGFTSTKFDVQIFDASASLVDVSWAFVLAVNS